jgi:hypothetical protein
MHHNVWVPFETTAIDVAGTLPWSDHRNRYLLIYVAYFTKWPEARVIPNLRGFDSDRSYGYQLLLLLRSTAGAAQ